MLLHRVSIHFCFYPVHLQPIVAMNHPVQLQGCARLSKSIKTNKPKKTCKCPIGFDRPIDHFDCLINQFDWVWSIQPFSSIGFHWVRLIWQSKFANDILGVFLVLRLEQATNLFTAMQVWSDWSLLTEL